MIKVDHWHVGIHFVVVVGLEEKKIPVDPDLSWNVSEELRKNPRIIR